VNDPCMPITPDVMIEVLGLGEVEAEAALFERLRHIDKIHKLSYSETGNICLKVQAHLLHEMRTDPDNGEPCSFSRWLHLAAPYSYSTCYAAMRDCEAMKDISEEHLSEIPASNFPILRQLSTAVRSEPEILIAAKTKKIDEFVEHIKRSFPSQHLESRKSMRFHPEESAAEKIESALSRAESMGARTRDESLEWIAGWAMDWISFKEEEIAIDRAMRDMPEGAIQ